MKTFGKLNAVENKVLERVGLRAEAVSDSQPVRCLGSRPDQRTSGAHAGLVYSVVLFTGLTETLDEHSAQLL